jgi:hypothetical protein
MVFIEPLKEQIPEDDQGSKEPVVKVKLLEGRQAEQFWVGQELEEVPQQVGRAELGGGGGRFF